MKISTNERVRIARERAGVTQAGAANEIGVSLRTYRKREHGVGEGWRLTELESLSKAFGVTLADLVG
jgi:DNA-binding XRE family transcriptional regulator